MINECREQLNKNGIYLLKPKGNSMLPFIKGKTEVVVAVVVTNVKKRGIGDTAFLIKLTPSRIKCVFAVFYVTALSFKGIALIVAAQKILPIIK